MSGSPETFPAGDRVQLLVPVLGLEARAIGTVVASFERLLERTYLVEFDEREVELADDLLVLAPADAAR